MNTYTHHHHDIVLEWCCGMPAKELADALRASGVEAPLEGVDSRPSSIREPHAERLDLGDASIVLRCLSASWCQDDVASLGEIADQNLRRYQ
ncbi:MULTISPECIES: hypothetical protein [Streptomyces]|uniref:Uncharacterized protein n=2 Tax=Streptomyces TaxID=1883 RepID=A0ABU4KCT1_9ACTN|nr:hypothetical protein [Streptomyces roseolus]MDX2295574.1 hypothetical protein [Streptomyces roseolus]